MKSGFEVLPVGEHQQPVLVGQYDFPRALRGESSGGLVNIGLASEKLGFDRVRFQDVDQCKDVGLFGPAFVFQASVVAHHAHETLHIRAQKAAFGFQRLHYLERCFAARRAVDDEGACLERRQLLRSERVCNRCDGQDTFIDIAGRVLEPHQGRFWRLEDVHIDALGGERVCGTTILGCQVRDGGHCELFQMRSVRGIAVTAAVHVARSSARDNRVFRIVADAYDVVGLQGMLRVGAQSRNRTRQSVAASSIDTTDAANQK